MDTQYQFYCLQCGNPLSHQELEGRIRDVCPACGWIHYLQLKVGAGALIEQDGRLLLLKRNQHPWKRCWNLPAGYVEADENPARAAERETFEETGLQVQARELLDAIYFDDDPRGNGIFLVYRCELREGQPRGSAEVAELAFFKPHEIPENLAGAGHAQTILNWQRQNS